MPLFIFHLSLLCNRRDREGQTHIDGLISVLLSGPLTSSSNYDTHYFCSEFEACPTQLNQCTRSPIKRLQSLSLSTLHQSSF